MMICEKCEKELSTSIGACESCGHDPVLKRMDLYRERRNQQLTSFKQTQEPSQDIRAASRTPRANAKDATLIRFPKRPATPPQPTPQPSAPPVLTETVPPWKERLNLRLQEIREQREPSAAPARPESKLDRNPVIINALNRIHRADYLQPITPLPHSRSSSAVELAPTPVAEITSQPDIEAHAVAPVMPRPTIVPPFVAESQFEASATAFTTDNELGSEIHFEATAHPAVEDKPATTSHSALEAASLGKRVAAAVIDAEIIASSLLPLFGAYFFLSGWFEAPTILVPMLVSVVLITVYFFVTYALAGRTMGMAWCNLHLASLSSNAETLANAAPSTITFTIRQAVLRALGGTISLLLFPVNIICIARSDDRLSLSDYLSDTQVVRIRK
jgi:uncharacterized RDD family membrane protein YckC